MKNDIKTVIIFFTSGLFIFIFLIQTVTAEEVDWFVGITHYNEVTARILDCNDENGEEQCTIKTSSEKFEGRGIRYGFIEKTADKEIRKYLSFTSFTNNNPQEDFIDSLVHVDYKFKGFFYRWLYRFIEFNCHYINKIYM